MKIEEVQERCVEAAESGNLKIARIMLELHQSMVAQLKLETEFVRPPQPLFSIPAELLLKITHRDDRHELGFEPPLFSSEEREAMPEPATGLIVRDEMDVHWIFAGGAWKPILHSGSIA